MAVGEVGGALQVAQRIFGSTISGNRPPYPDTGPAAASGFTARLPGLRRHPRRSPTRLMTAARTLSEIRSTPSARENGGRHPQRALFMADCVATSALGAEACGLEPSMSARACSASARGTSANSWMVWKRRGSFQASSGCDATSRPADRRRRLPGDELLLPGQLRLVEKADQSIPGARRAGRRASTRCRHCGRWPTPRSLAPRERVSSVNTAMARSSARRRPASASICRCNRDTVREPFLSQVQR